MENETGEREGQTTKTDKGKWLKKGGGARRSKTRKGMTRKAEKQNRRRTEREVRKAKQEETKAGG